MKRKLLLALCLLSMLTYNAHADRYIRFGLGYALPNASQTRDVDGFPYSGSAYIGPQGGFTDMEVKKASFGTGLWATLTTGHMITKNFGLEIGGVIGIAPKSYTVQINYANGYQEYTQQAKTPVFITPTMLLQTGNKVRVYLKSGLVLPLSSKMSAKYSERQGADYITAAQTISSKFNIGFTGALGMKVNILKGVDFWADANVTSLSLYVKKVDLTSYQYNGMNVLNYIANKSTSYSNNMNGASELATYSYPFSTIGMNIGLSFNFGK